MKGYRLSRRAFLAASAAAAAAMGRAGARAAEGPAAGGFRFVEEPGGRLRVLEGDLSILTYNWGDQLPDGVPKDRTRSCYVHPVWAPDGTVLTDDFPKDHYHHRGIFWTWQRMKVAGKAVSLWDIRGIRQRFGAWNQREASAERASLDVSNDWLLDDGRRVARERLRVTVHRASDAGRAVDFSLALEAVDGPVELLGAEGKGYGGFSFRFAPRRDTVIVADGRKQGGDSNDGTFRWADLSARFAGGQGVAGAAIFVHPESRAKPRGWTLRPYGFLGPSWPGLVPHTLEPGVPATLLHRVWLHRGDAAAGQVAEAYEAYAAGAAALRETS